MNQKILSIFLALAVAVSLAACTGTAESETGTDPTEITTNPTEPAQTSPTLPMEEDPQPFTQTLVDNEDCVVKITGIDPDGVLGYTVKLYCENKTDKDLMFALRESSVNGFMCDPMWATTISAGMKANEEFYFLSSDFARNGITDVTRIDFALHIYNSNDWTEEALVDDTFTVYPLGEEAYVPAERVLTETDMVLADNAHCTVIVTGFEPESTFGYVMKLYVENKTDKTLMFTASNVAVNGFMSDPFWAVTVTPGMKSNTEVTWFRSDLESNNITEVTQITFPIRVYDNDNWADEDLLNETFTIIP